MCAFSALFRYDFPSPWWDQISKDAIDLVKKCLTVDPKKRITAADVCEHPWIKNASEKPLESASGIKKYVAALRLKKAAKNLMAMQKLQKAAS